MTTEVSGVVSRIKKFAEQLETLKQTKQEVFRNVQDVIKSTLEELSSLKHLFRAQLEENENQLIELKSKETIVPKKKFQSEAVTTTEEHFIFQLQHIEKLKGTGKLIMKEINKTFDLFPSDSHSQAMLLLYDSFLQKRFPHQKSHRLILMLKSIAKHFLHHNQMSLYHELNKDLSAFFLGIQDEMQHNENDDLLFNQQHGRKNELISQEIVLAYQQLHEIVETLKKGHVTPALNWLQSHQKLSNCQSHLMFALHKLHFLGHLQKENNLFESLRYTRQHFLAYLDSLLRPQISELIGSLAFSKDMMSPYENPNISGVVLTTHVVKAFKREFCTFGTTPCGDDHESQLVKLPLESPLSVAVSAGMASLPFIIQSLRAFHTSSAIPFDEWEETQKLPIEIDLGPQFHFHSCFTCPICRHSGEELNTIPCRLTCGHVICRSCVNQISNRATRRSGFQCPTCAQSRLSLTEMKILILDWPVFHHTRPS